MAEIAERVAAVRRFNRFYTRRIGVLREGLVDSPFSLTELRLLYELAHWPKERKPTASELGQELDLDAGYLSRLLRYFRKRGLIAGKASEADGRQVHLWLTALGERTFAPLEARTSDEVAALLGKLSADRQSKLVGAMQTIEGLLDGKSPRDDPHKTLYLLRPHQPGDMGSVIHLHGALYAREYGWDERFEALVAEIAANFIRDFDPKSERCWIAEKDGEVVGSVFLVRQSKTVAKLRLLIVDPKARGLGLGKRLVDECIRFARQKGYRKITLWTQSVLTAARHIYEGAGFKLVGREPHKSFGVSLVGEEWELRLGK
jgi:DNA-binding MarR family transcriptional regulator/GNAT superfamily N-acetyltransferase